MFNIRENGRWLTDVSKSFFGTAVKRGRISAYLRRTIQELKVEVISVNLVEVHKSGAGPMAVLTENRYLDAAPGVAVQFDENRFRLVTTRKEAGGRARPLEIIRLY